MVILDHPSAGGSDYVVVASTAMVFEIRRLRSSLFRYAISRRPADIYAPSLRRHAHLPPPPPVRRHVRSQLPRWHHPSLLQVRILR